MPDSLLDIQNLQIINSRSHEKILSDISFQVERGKITGIVGESGSGKSITALSLLHLLPNALIRTKGKAILHNENSTVDLFELSDKEINKFRGKDISMIFQEPMTSLNPSMKCGKQVAETLRYHFQQNEDQSKPSIIQFFKHTGLPDPERIYYSYPHQLSGGQRQRVMIAMALITKPSLIIADEPTTALDVSVQKSIIQLLKNLQNEFNLTVIFITHDLRLLGEIADNIIVMRDGKVVEAGTKQNIFSNAKEAYTQGLLECQPPLDSKPERLLTVEDFERKENKGHDDIHTSPGMDSDISEKHENEAPEVLSIQGLYVSYQKSAGIISRKKTKFNAVDNVSLKLYRGETLGLVGESGCGKTTLGKTILKLIESSSGDIIFKGLNLAEMSNRQRKEFRKKVQVVFQDPYSSLNPRMKIGKMLSEIRKIHFPGETRTKRNDHIKSLLVKTGLRASDREKYPHEFSGGQRQRIGIARALITEPELVVLDESVSALDVSVQAQILNLLNDLKRQLHLSYIFISHDLAVVKYMSDRIIVMKEGKFEETGAADDVYRNPISDYTKKLIDAVPGFQNSSGSS